MVPVSIKAPMTGRPSHGYAMQSPLSDLIHETALAADLKKSRRTLQIWRKERTGPAPTIIGRDVYYSRRSIEKWLQSKEKHMVRERAAR